MIVERLSPAWSPEYAAAPPWMRSTTLLPLLEAPHQLIESLCVERVGYRKRSSHATRSMISPNDESSVMKAPTSAKYYLLL